MKTFLLIALMILIIMMISCAPSLNAQVPVPSQPYTPYLFTPNTISTQSPYDLPLTPTPFSTNPHYWSPTYQTEWALTGTPIYEPNFNSNFTFKSHLILKDLVDELRLQMSSRQYQEFLDFQNEWEYLVQRQCRWQAELFFAGSSPLVQEDQCLYKQYLQRIDVLLVLLCRKYGTTGECQDAEKYREMLQRMGK